MTGRNRLWEILEVAKMGDRGSRLFDSFILSLIILNVLAVIFGTVESITLVYGPFLEAFETFSIVVFSFEYIGRLWSCVEDKAYNGPVAGRLRYMMTPMAFVDLVAILPFFLPFIGVDMRFARVFRLMRLFRLFKAARYITSMRLIGDVFRARREELIFTSFLMLLLLVAASSVMFLVENDAQPDKFTDIPSTMWWSVATLTTVGYGDIYPVTGLGKVMAAIVAILGIGFFALPTGILGSAFVEAIETGKERRKSRSVVCPHCQGEFTPDENTGP